MNLPSAISFIKLVFSIDWLLLLFLLLIRYGKWARSNRLSVWNVPFEFGGLNDNIEQLDSSYIFDCANTQFDVHQIDKLFASLFCIIIRSHIHTLDKDVR